MSADVLVEAGRPFVSDPVETLAGFATRRREKPSAKTVRALRERIDSETRKK